MRLPRRPIAALLAIGTVAALATGCTISEKKADTTAAGSGSIKKIPALSGAAIKVGSKEFDEQLLFGQILMVALQAAGASPVDKTNITGSDNVRKALTTGAIDLYWEYTGTGWISFLKKTQPIADPVAQFNAIKQADAANNITWWGRSTADDTYAMAESKPAMDKYHVKTVSEYAALVKSNPAAASTCLGAEFSGRDDGFAGLQKHYGFQLPDASRHLLNDAVIYPTLGKSQTCNFGSVASTDGRIPANNLTVLNDDKHFFPIYNPSVTIRTPLAQKYPQLEQVFSSIANKLDTPTLLRLNKEVSVDGKKPYNVAHDWMKSAGFIK